MNAIKEYIKSFRIITATQVAHSVLGALVGGFIGLAAVNAMSLLSGDVSEDFRAGFWAGFTPAFGILVPMLAMVILNGVFAALNPMAQGYKYFHSLPNGAEHFRRALICANLVSVLACVVWGLVMIPVNGLIGNSFMSCIDIALGLVMLGTINITGFSGKLWARLIGIVPICLGFGFAGGLTVAMSEDGETIDAVFVVIMMAVCLVVFFVGLVYALLNAKKKWYAAEKLSKKEARA